MITYEGKSVAILARPCKAGSDRVVSTLFPAVWKIDSYLRLLVNADSLERLRRGDSAEDIVRSWDASLENFRRIRSRALLYQ